jgi:hypothetical protein
MTSEQLLFYIYTIYVGYCITYLVISVECIELFSVVPNIASYLIGMSFIVLRMRNLITHKYKRLFLTYFGLQFIWNLLYIIYIQFEESCSYTKRAEVILYLIVLYTNIVLYGWNIQIIKATPTERVEFIPMEVVSDIV